MVELLGRGIQISLNSDDPAQFGSGWLNQTLSEAQQAGKFSLETMRAFMRNGFLSAWLTNDEKLRYLARFDEAHTQLEHAGVDAFVVSASAQINALRLWTRSGFVVMPASH